MAKLKVENQRRQKVLTAYAYGKELNIVSHFFLAVVDTSTVECAYGVHLWFCAIKRFYS